MLLNLFFKSIQIFSLETKTFSSIRDDFLIINVFQKQKPRIFYYCCKDYPKLSVSYFSFTSEIIQDLQRWNEDTQRILRIHGHAEFFFIFVSLFCLLQKKNIYVGTERSPHQPNDNNITQNKGSNFIHHSIIYCEERDKIQKNPSSTSDDLSETIDSELFINKSHVILHALQKLQYIYKFQWDFPLSLSFFLSLLYSS